MTCGMYITFFVVRLAYIFLFRSQKYRLIIEYQLMRLREAES